MNILVVNDDGIRSPGLRALVDALSEKADVFVCAPDGQRSAKSHAITLDENVLVQRVVYPGAKGALQTSGTPADCTKIGLQFFAEEGCGCRSGYERCSRCGGFGSKPQC